MKIITKIFGGLGNQMFQYACGKTVACRLDTQLFLDLSWFEKGNRLYMLNAFPNINYSIYNKKKMTLLNFLRRIGIKKKYFINEPFYSYWTGIEDIKSTVILSGYWQNEKYFSCISKIIKQDFIFPEFDCIEAKNIEKNIKKASCPISVHVRRGDYIENQETNSFHGLCSPEYYKNAIKYIIDKNDRNVIPELYLFSDDPDWVKNNFDTCGLTSVVVDIKAHKYKPYHDMHLLSLCKNHIIANSSFSWWGAWLSSGNGTVVAPKYWFAEDTMKDNNPSLASWILL